MPWYLWVAAYMIIIAMGIFWVIPEKPWWLIVLLIAVGYGGYKIICHFPREKAPK